MATFFFDIDGVLFSYGTNNPIKNNIERLVLLKNNGHKIILTTARKSTNNQPHHLNILNTKQVLLDKGIPFDEIIEDVTSPRIIINDEGAYAYKQWTNQLFNNSTLNPEFDKNKFTVERRCTKIFNSIASIAWTSLQYGAIEDADEYFQTITIANSLILNNGFDHKDLVGRFRKSIQLKSGVVISPGGTSEKYKGQISKLAASDDDLYMANDGVSDGAAMRTAAVASIYYNDFVKMIVNNDHIAQITHFSAEARMSACLCVIRLKQALHPYKIFSPTDLLSEFKYAIKILGLEDKCGFFFDRCELACQIALSTCSPFDQIVLLNKNIGLDHLSWSTPISAVFWTFHGDCNFKFWLSHNSEKQILIPIKTSEGKDAYCKLDATTYSDVNRQKDIAHLKEINEYQSFMNSHAYHYGVSIDIDTFFSISYSILSAIHGIENILPELGDGLSFFGDNLFKIAGMLTSKSEVNQNAA